MNGVPITGMRNVEDLKSAAVYARANLNPSLFAYAFSVALLHREDTKDIAIPSEADVFPAKYLHGSVFRQAREESATVANPAHRVRQRKNNEQLPYMPGLSITRWEFGSTSGRTDIRKNPCVILITVWTNAMFAGPNCRSQNSKCTGAWTRSSLLQGRYRRQFAPPALAFGISWLRGHSPRQKRSTRGTFLLYAPTSIGTVRYREQRIITPLDQCLIIFHVFSTYSWYHTISFH